MDSRIYLKIKLKALAEESRIIRIEERKQLASERWLRQHGQSAISNYGRLYRHRLDVVRHEARHTILAYGFIRERAYSRIEPRCHEKPNWDKVATMVFKYGDAACEKRALQISIDKWSKVTQPRLATV